MTTQTLETARQMGMAAMLPAAKAPPGAFVDMLSANDEVMLARLLTEPVDYVDHPEFIEAPVERELFGGPAKLLHRLATRFAEQPDRITDAIVAGERLPALSYDQERHLFMRYNYARWQIARILHQHRGRRLTAMAARTLLAWGHRMLQTRTVIVRLNMPLVLAMAKRTKLSSMDFNEMISEGNMALLRSVEKFDCSRGYKFSTYSCRAILKAFSRVAMRASRYRGQFPTEFDPAMERSDYAELRRENVEVDCVDELKKILIDNLAGLSDVEKTVIKERFALGMMDNGHASMPKTLEQVGLIIGVTKERVTRHLAIGRRSRCNC